jgi:hypothetical protein
MIGSWGIIYGLQRLFPYYGRKISLGSFVIDAGIYALSAGFSALFSLNEMEVEMKPLRKQWIT